MINLSQIGRFTTDTEGAAEIAAYDSASRRLFVVNAAKNRIDVLDLSDPTSPSLVFPIILTSGSPNSVAVYDGLLAVAVADNTETERGSVAFFESDGSFISSVEVGVLPDMLTFTPDGSRVLVANEGEPNDEYTVDPVGSISIIDVESKDVTTADFAGFNNQKQALIDSGVRIFAPGATVAQDLEPEYIAVSTDGSTAFVTLQENNAFAVVDIAAGEVTEIIPLGFKDYSQENNSLDTSDRDSGINLRTFDNLLGMYQPDAVASYEVNGETFYVTANEGDARDYNGFSEEVRVDDLTLDPTAFPNASELQQDENLGRLKTTTELGDTDGDGDFDQIYSYGGRSFSIWNSNGELVFDSGNQIATITANLVPELFNSQGDADSFDSRSDDKGAEPEGVVTGVVDGKTYAFIGLERIGGVMVYNVSNPEAPEFVQYVRTEGDIAPEGLVFIAAEDSPNSQPLLVVANEVSGSTTVYEIDDGSAPNPAPTIVINEVDADTEGSDSAEFVELYDGGVGNTALDGLTVVFFNGSDDASYEAFDLDGFTTNGDGFFVLGNPGVANAELIFQPGSFGALQNGADAVALYQGDAADFSNDTPATTTNLVDAIVYDTNDSDDAGLLAALGQDTQFNEGANGNKDTESNSRVPDGTGTFIAQAPTPGESNEVTPTPSVVINEVDADQDGTDGAEFIELFDGGAGNTALDGLTLVLFNGSNDQSYNAIALDGFITDTDGFFVVGSDSVPNVDLAAFTTNGIQNGADAVALYQASASEFPNGTAPTTTNLVDAIVYGTNDADDAELLAGLGQDTQFNEDTTTSSSRVPNGTGSFVAQAPTPGLTNDSASVVTPIYEIQGASQVSPFVLADGQTVVGFFNTLPADTLNITGDSVTTSGVVTAVDSNGFYVQDPTGDGNIATSDALFVFTGANPGVTVGDSVEVAGTVAEFFPGDTDTRNLPTTQITDATVTVLSSGNALPAPVNLGTGGRVLPDINIDDDAFAEYQPDSDGIDFFESLEGMRVTAQDTVAVAPTNRFGEIFTVLNGGINATGISDRGTLNISPDDFNPEKVQIDADSGVFNFELPNVDTGAALGNVTGVVSYGFGNFEIIPTEAFTATDSTIEPEVTTITPAADRLTIASYNVLNLDPNDDDGDTDVASGRFEAIALQIVNNLNSPDIIGLQEVQDNNGSVNNGVTSADQTLQQLVNAIADAGGKTYEFIDNTFITDGESGGQPGGNIRTAFLYNPNRVDVVDGSVQTISSQEPGAAFDGARLPLVAAFEFNGEEVTVINNHFSSKGGSAPILGIEQNFADRQEDVTVNGSLDERQAQSQAVQDFVNGVFTDDANANVVALGDFNEFEFVSPVQELEDNTPLTNLTNTLPEDERYSFIFQGNSQSLDHILVSESLADNAEFDVVHVNSEFAETESRASDHDPLITSLIFEGATSNNITVEVSAKSNAGFTNIGGFYQALDAEGTVIDPITGEEVAVGEEGYTDAALANSVVEIGDGENRTLELDDSFEYIPYLLANTQRFFTAFAEANPDGIDHVQSIDENTFGFEDLLGGGDMDFDDYIISFEVV